MELSFESPPFSWLAACIFKTMIWHQKPLRTTHIHDNLSLTNTTVLTKKPVPNLIFAPYSIKKNNPLLLLCHLFPHLTFYTPNQSDLYFVNFLATVVSEPDIYRLLTLHAPNLIPLFHCLGQGSSTFQIVRATLTISMMPAGHINNFNDARGPQSYTSAFRIVSCFPDTQRTTFILYVTM
jgi:hypothetical protein